MDGLAWRTARRAGKDTLECARARASRPAAKRRQLSERFTAAAFPCMPAPPAAGGGGRVWPAGRAVPAASVLHHAALDGRALQAHSRGCGLFLCQSALCWTLCFCWWRATVAGQLSRPSHLPPPLAPQTPTPPLGSSCTTCATACAWCGCRQTPPRRWVGGCLTQDA